MLGLGGLLFVCGILTHCMCTMTDRAAEQCNDIVPIEPSETSIMRTTVTELPSYIEGRSSSKMNIIKEEGV